MSQEWACINGQLVPADQAGVPILFLLSRVDAAHAFWTHARDGGGDLVVTAADGTYGLFVLPGRYRLTVTYETVSISRTVTLGSEVPA